jgi:hypothetical protein
MEWKYSEEIGYREVKVPVVEARNWDAEVDGWHYGIGVDEEEQKFYVQLLHGKELWDLGVYGSLGKAQAAAEAAEEARAFYDSEERLRGPKVTCYDV